MGQVYESKIRIEDHGEAGCSIFVDNHQVASWHGDGIASDTVFIEAPALQYLVTTTAHQRCLRIVFEMVHWEVLSAILEGPGDGQLRPYCETYSEDEL